VQRKEKPTWLEEMYPQSSYWDMWSFNNYSPLISERFLISVQSFLNLKFLSEKKKFPKEWLQNQSSEQSISLGRYCQLVLWV
jgi:hypothetical protein